MVMDPRHRWFAGILSIFFVAVIWTLATVLKQVIFQDLDFDEPLILTFVCNACYTVYLPLYPLQQRLKANSDVVDAAAAVTQAEEIRKAIRVGIAITPVWFFSQWTYSAGVALTSVTSSTVISTTSVVWTLFASVMFLGESLSMPKVVGVVFCMAGNVATLFGNDRQGGQEGHLRGDLLCLVSAMLYAAYTTVLKRYTSERTSCSLVFGTVGAVMVAVVAPLILLFDMRGLRQMTGQIFGLLVFNGLFDNVLSQHAWMKAVQWTSPTAATVGLSLTIPLSVLADMLRQKPLTGWSFISATLVVAGFAVVSMATEEASDEPALLSEVASGNREPLQSGSQSSAGSVLPVRSDCVGGGGRIELAGASGTIPLSPSASAACAR